MKRLSDFLEFRLKEFLQDKTIRVTDQKQWFEDAEKKVVLGDSIEGGIARDNTLHTTKAGEQLRNVNLYEKFSIKVPVGHTPVKIGDIIEIVDGKATVYGDYRNKLSVRAKDVRVINPQSQGGKA